MIILETSLIIVNYVKIRHAKILEKKNKIKIAEDKKAYSLNLKLDGIQKYGGKCVCCGESNPKFLTIDHIFGRVGEEKECRVKWTGRKMWAKLKKLNYPTDNYQLLCFNCNCCKGIYGICPHQTKYKE